MASITILTAYNEYVAETNKRHIELSLSSVITRFLVPCLCGPLPKSIRASSEEVSIAKLFLSTKNCNELINITTNIELMFEENQVPKGSRKSYRYILKNFINWVVTKGYSEVTRNNCKAKDEENNLLKNRGSRGRGKDRKTSYYGIKRNIQYALMAKSSAGQLIYTNDYINKHLETELITFKKYREISGCAKATVLKELKVIRLILGWLHRYKSQPLENLKLTSIIFYCQLIIPLNLSLNKLGIPDFNEHFLAKAVARQKAIELAKENIKLVKDYLDSMYDNPRSKVTILATITAIAKFVFKDEVDGDDYVDDFDLPIIIKLNQLSNQYQKQSKVTPPSVPHSKKSISWEEVLKTCESLRKDYLTLTYQTNHYDKDHKYTRTRVRPQVALYNSLQVFLSLMFMAVIPPNRARTYYELEIDRTLVYGIYERGRFVSKDYMTESDLCQWYIHLEPQDYKTGKRYGEWWSPIPNPEFSDGSKLYEYIKKWLQEGREYNQPCNHNYFFRGINSYKPCYLADWYNRIRTIFVSNVGIPVTSKELRKIYVTYLKDSGATEAELEAAAYAMQHSRRMQSQTYDEQNKINKMNPIHEFNKRIVTKYFSNIDLS